LGVPSAFLPPPPEAHEERRRGRAKKRSAGPNFVIPD